MPLPQDDPSLPSLPAPVFADVDAGRGDHLRLNNQKIWINLNYLDARIDTEAAARASADSTLQTNINSEASTRGSADTTLQNNINSEASTRASADTTLQGEIDGLDTRVTTLESTTVLQSIFQSSGAADNTAVNIPHDNTKPQNTEGKQVFSQAITPAAAGNIIEVEWQLNLSHGNAAGNATIAALFKDSDADAICALVEINDNGSTGGYVMRGLYRETAGSTSARTYKLRYGSNAGTAYLNGFGGGIFDGVNISWFKVTEIAT
jgi:hypothetical protein